MTVKLYGMKLQEHVPEWSSVPGSAGFVASSHPLVYMERVRELARASTDWRDSCVRLSQPGGEFGEPTWGPPATKGEAHRAVSFPVKNLGETPVVMFIGHALESLSEPRSFTPPMAGREWIVEVPAFAGAVTLYTLQGCEWGVWFRDPKKRAGVAPWKVRVLISEGERSEVEELEAL